MDGFVFAMEVYMISLEEWDRDLLWKIYLTLTILSMKMEHSFVLKKWSYQENHQKDSGHHDSSLLIISNHHYYYIWITNIIYCLFDGIFKFYNKT